MDQPELATPSGVGRFHENHGKYIQLQEENTIAQRLRSWDNGVVFSGVPIPVGTVFQVKLLEKTDGWTGCLGLGFTTHSPDSITAMPKSIQSPTKDPKWFVAAACSSEDERVFDTVDLSVGQTLGCMISKKGNLHYFLDGEDSGVVRRGLPTNKPLWGFADINATAKKIQFDANPPVAKQRSRFSLRFRGRTRQASTDEGLKQVNSEAENKPTVDSQAQPEENKSTPRKQNSPENPVAEVSKQEPENESPPQQPVEPESPPQKPVEPESPPQKPVDPESPPQKPEEPESPPQKPEEPESPPQKPEEPESPPQKPVEPESPVTKPDPEDKQVATVRREDSDQTDTPPPKPPKSADRKQDPEEKHVAAIRRQDSERRQIELLRESLDAALIEVEELKQQRNSAISEAQQQKSAAEENQQQLQLVQKQLDPAGVQQPRSSLPAVESEIEVSRIEVEIPGEMNLQAWGSDGEGRFRGQRVAVKLLHPDTLKDYTIARLRKETQASSLLRHPNLMQFIATVFDDEKSPLIVTEFLQTNLRTAYQKGLLLNSKSDKVRIFQDVAYALHYLHERQEPIIHRNVSTPNVLLEELSKGMWRAKLTDLVSANLARLAQSTTGENDIIFAAPEAVPQTADPDSSTSRQGPSSPPQTTKVDVYSYGVLVCEIVTSKLPNPTEYPSMLQEMHGEWLPMHELVVHCTKRKPHERATMSQILDKLNVSRCLPTTQTRTRQTSV